MTNPPSVYDSWSREQLIERLVQLDDVQRLSQPQPQASFPFSSYPRRKIALKFCYSGWEYNGLAHQLGPTPLPTVEGTLFAALAHARLVDPAAGFDGCEFERCGRTDRGVSAAGQVVSLYVRSALKAPTNDPPPPESPPASLLEGDLSLFDDDLTMEEPSNTSIAISPPTSELNYISILNRLLPPTIRILAWSPVLPTFSARFKCKYRHYKYFFSASPSLDIQRMRDAASRLVGEHDFRNLCKLDPAKQITSFRRRILRADISPLPDNNDSIYVLDLVGTAFLYHQVRHIMAVLFLVGSGLEHPSIVTTLMNVAPGAEHPDDPSSSLEVLDRKPEYQMADGLPLMLWDCGYSEEDVQWRIDADGADAAYANDTLTQSGSGSNLYHQLDSILQRSTTHNILDAHFLQAAAKYHLPNTNNNSSEPLNIPLGGGTFKRMTKYIPLLQRKRLDSVDVANERWRTGKGHRKEERKRAAAAVVNGGDDDDE